MLPHYGRLLIMVSRWRQWLMPARFEEHLLSPRHYFPAYDGGLDRVAASVEDGHIKFLFQLLDECRQGRLRYAARVGGFGEMAVFVYRHDIFHLL